MSETKKCSQCCYYAEPEILQLVSDPETEIIHGECRLNPPQVYFSPKSIYPIVREKYKGKKGYSMDVDYCLEICSHFRPREEKK